MVARVHGLATAAGCQLVATADLAVASEDAGFAAPGGKGGWFCHTPMVAVARNVGRKRAMELALSGDVIDARTALNWGLVNQVVPAADLDGAVQELLDRVTRGSAESKGIGKQALYAQIDLDQPKAYAYAIEVMAATSQLPDAREGMRRSWRSASRAGAAAGRPSGVASGVSGTSRRPGGPGGLRARHRRLRHVNGGKRISLAGLGRMRRSLSEGAPFPHSQRAPGRRSRPGAPPAHRRAGRRWPRPPSSVPVPGTWSVRAADPARLARPASTTRRARPPEGRRARGPARGRVRPAALAPAPAAEPRGRGARRARPVGGWAAAR